MNKQTMDTQDDGFDAGGDWSASADALVHRLETFNDKVTAMQQERIDDPDTVGDKIIRMALPAIAGLVAGKIFEAIWNAGVARHGGANKETEEDSRRQGLMMSLLFAAVSSAFGAVISQLSDRGSQHLVSRLQHRREAKQR